MTPHKDSISCKIYWRLTNIAIVNDAILEKVNKGRENLHINILSWTSFVIVSPHQVLYAKLLTLDKEDNVMSYVCSYSHGSYIVIDPLTCGAFPISLLAKNPH
jgi:hypothetical protein